MESRRYKVNIKIDLETPVEKLQKLKTRVEEMLYNRENILDDSTIVRFDGIDENGINMLVYTYSKFNRNIVVTLKEVEGINYKNYKNLRRRKY